jgi:hypothetical protein
MRERQAVLGGGPFALEAALSWWESKLASAKQIKKWTRDELCQKIDSYKERLTALETK